MNIEELIGLFRINERIAIWASHVIVCICMACLTIPLVEIMRRFEIIDHGEYFIWLTIFVSIEAMISSYRLNKHITIDKYLYRLVEWFTIIILLKFVQTIHLGFGNLLIQLPKWQEDFFSSFISGEFIVGIVILAIIWNLSTRFAEDLQELSGDEIIVEGIRLEAMIRDRGDSRKRIVNRILTVGVGIILLTAIVRIDLKQIFGEGVFSPSRIIVINVIVYFILGILLLSLTQFSNLRLAWAWEQIPIPQNIARNWIIYALIIFIIVGIVAFLLPTGYSVGFLPVLGYLLNLVIYLLNFVIFIVLIPFTLILSLLIKVFGDETIGPVEDLKPPVSQMPSVPQIPSVNSTINNPVIDSIKSILFWLIFIFLIGYILYLYMNQNWEIVRKIQSIPLIRWVTHVWKWISGYIQNSVYKLTEIAASGINRLNIQKDRKPKVSGWRFPIIRKLAPRDQVLFWYLALIRSGGKYGYDRKPHQTPYEYAASISSNLVEASEDIEQITNAFMEARYSTHQITRESAGYVRQYWVKIKKAMQQFRKG